MFWQKDIETISRSALEELQLKRLKQTVRQAYKNIPFYKEQFSKLNLKPKDITSLKDIQKLPFTTREDLRENYPFGMLAVAKEQVVRLHTSSGTTGKPKAIFFSKKDVDRAAELIARCLIMTGVKKDDVLQNMMTYGLFTGALVMHYGAEKVGVLVIPAGPGNTKRQIALMQDFKTTTLHLTPSYALYLAGVMNNEGLDPKEIFLSGGHIWVLNPTLKKQEKRLKSSLSIDVYNSYGLSEMNGPGVAFECIEKNGMHLWEDNFIMEIIDPDTGEKMPEGEKGELVLTTLYREAMPILRYRTRDIAMIIPGKCKCGRTHRRISRIIGRTDDMIIVRGVNIFPQQIERVLMGIKAVAQNYQIVLESYDQMTVRVEISKELFDGKVEHLVNLQTEITEKLRSEILVKPKVELLEPGTLPVSEGKATRVIDKRTL